MSVPLNAARPPIERTPLDLNLQYYLGVDPGLSGALAILDHGGAIRVEDTPVLDVGRGKKVRREYDLPALVRLLDSFRPPRHYLIHAMLELVGPMPGQGVTSMFRMGWGVGMWETLFAALAIPYSRVAPTRWKKVMLEGQGVGGDKEASRLRAAQLFPTLALGRVKDHGRAEAALLAEYCRRQARQGLL